MGSGPDPSLFPFPARFHFWLLVLSAADVRNCRLRIDGLLRVVLVPSSHISMPFLICFVTATGMTACFVTNNVYQTDQKMIGKYRDGAIIYSKYVAFSQTFSQTFSI